MRNCRRCQAPFQPRKPHYHWCSLACRRADYLAAEARPYTAADVGRAYDRGFDAGYARGFAEGRGRVNGSAAPAVPPEVYKKLAVMVPPDRHQGSPLEPLAHELMVWLNAHKPKGGADGSTGD